MKVGRKLACGYVFGLSLPDDMFNGGGLVFSCPKCGARWIVHTNGNTERFEREPLRFLAMHN